jgi:hypothetical protein
MHEGPMNRPEFPSSPSAMTARAQSVLAVVSTVLVLTAFAAVTRAQAPASSKVAAEAFFDRGVALMKAGKFAEGCAQLEQSQAIERGIGTMLYLAECYERLGRIASAWALFREAASAARAEGQVERGETGAARAAQLEPKLPKLTVEVEAGNTMAGFTVQVNGVTLSRGAWGVSLPVDPGDNRIEASAPGYLRFSHVETVGGEGAIVIVTVPALVADPHAAQAPAPIPVPSAASVAAASSDAPKNVTAPPHDTPPPRTWQRPLAIVVGGTGVLALGIGSYFGLHAISKSDAADARCPGSGATCADQRGAELSKQANDAAKLSNGFMIGGAALAAAGVVLYLTAPTQGAPALGVHGDGRSLRASFGGAF